MSLNSLLTRVVRGRFVHGSPITWPVPPHALHVRATKRILVDSGPGRAPALAADRLVRGRCCPLAVTGAAGLEAANLDFSLCSEKSSLEIYGESKRRSSPRCCRVAALLASAGVEHFAEHIAEYIADIHAAGKRTSAIKPARTAHASMPVAIVYGALVGVAENLVGLAGQFELFFSGVIARIAVGMVFQSACLR